jgi:hypothetical protein
LKTYLTSAPILAHPDFTKPFILDTDASGTAIGAVLSQMQDDNEKVTAYMPVGVLLSQNVNTV